MYLRYNNCRDSVGEHPPATLKVAGSTPAVEFFLLVSTDIFVSGSGFFSRTILCNKYS